ncbi:hypothetical protein [Clostridium sp.]|uniref:hypothetical protein n=1 Tax=Clostridium sp. TaxID=1506 RepID=UPI003216FBD9
MPYGLDSSQLVLVATIISIYISKDKSCDQIDLLGNIFTLIGANLLTLSSSCAIQDTENKSNDTEDRC